MAILPDFSAATFIPGAPINNPYLPLIPGHVLSYKGDEIDPETADITTERNDVLTTSAAFEVRGVSTTVIRDTVYEEDVILEDTFDWYAQDSAGNVWYFGEIVVNYEYDDDGNFIGVNHEGQWSADDPGNQPGWVMKATPEFGPAYYQEFAPGIAEDESIVAETGLSFNTPIGGFDDVIKTIDSSALSTGVEFKYYAPGVGGIAEVALAPDGTITSEVDIYRRGVVGQADPDDSDDVAPALTALEESKTIENLGEIRDLATADFAGTGTTKEVTVVGGSTDSYDALGAYFIDEATGAFGEARILVADLSDAPSGSSVAVDVPDGQSLCLFLVRGTDQIGVDLEQYTDGGLHLKNLLTGAPANLADPYAPTVVDDAGNILPIQPLSALGADDGGNLLNPAGSMQAIGLSSKVPGTGGIEIVGFEDRLNTSPDYDGDFNDAIVAVSEAPIAAEVLDQLIREAGGAQPEEIDRALPSETGEDGEDGEDGVQDDDPTDNPTGESVKEAANDHHASSELDNWMAGDTLEFADGALHTDGNSDDVGSRKEFFFADGDLGDLSRFAQFYDDHVDVPGWLFDGDAILKGPAPLGTDGFFLA
ncbi:hypothetical protein [Sinorhizobium fredii]|uniref:hypothetical protein n=1 Tax=Rhizobium fredii TaxID=380 RepID=UPI0004B6F47C|nr:hypothetical protein [Sinorhizobium fredii]AWI59567.1 hypothetical protein AB395_00003941 [Sinorhizobium fredii CCBAU 45436]